MSFWAAFPSSLVASLKHLIFGYKPQTPHLLLLGLELFYSLNELVDLAVRKQAHFQWDSELIEPRLREIRLIQGVLLEASAHSQFLSQPLSISRPKSSHTGKAPKQLPQSQNYYIDTGQLHHPQKQKSAKMAQEKHEVQVAIPTGIQPLG